MKKLTARLEPLLIDDLNSIDPDEFKVGLYFSSKNELLKDPDLIEYFGIVFDDYNHRIKITKNSEAFDLIVNDMQRKKLEEGEGL